MHIHIICRTYSRNSMNLLCYPCSIKLKTKEGKSFFFICSSLPLSSPLFFQSFHPYTYKHKHHNRHHIKTNVLFIISRLTITASCPMNLQYFPMDRQLCHIEIESCKYSFFFFPHFII